MADGNELHDHAGELQERRGGPVPLFLKLTYVGFTLFGIAYWLLYYAGDGSPLVRLLNAATNHGP